MFLDNVIGNERPVSWVLQFWPVLAASFVCALAATALCKKIALKFGIVDKPDNLVKTHKKPVAYLGGVGMLVGFAVGVIDDLFDISPGRKMLAQVPQLRGENVVSGVETPKVFTTSASRRLG